MIRIRLFKCNQRSTKVINRFYTSAFHRGVEFFFNKKNLLLTNSFTSGAFMAIGDLIQQEIEYESKAVNVRYDWPRAGNATNTFNFNSLRFSILLKITFFFFRKNVYNGNITRAHASLLLYVLG